MAHDHDCDLLLAATDAARILELAAEIEGDGRFMLVTCTDLLNHEDSADCEHTLNDFHRWSAAALDYSTRYVQFSCSCQKHLY